MEHVRNDWPRDGILRVEILRNGADDYNIEKSYAKEEKLRKDRLDDFGGVFSLLSREGLATVSLPEFFLISFQRLQYLPVSLFLQFCKY